MTDDDPVTWFDEHAVGWAVCLVLVLFVIAAI